MKKLRLVRTIILAGSLLLQLSTLCFHAHGAAGDVDLSFDPGSGVNGTVNAVALQPDGKVIIGGQFTTVKGLARQGVARLNADGSGDSSFDPGEGSYSVVSLVLQPDGKVLAGHYYGIVRLNSNGSLDTNFNATVWDRVWEPYPADNSWAPAVNSMAVQPDGKVLVCGDFDTVNDTSRNQIARLNADGSLDNSFDVGTVQSGSVLSVSLQPDGKVFVGGYFTSVNGTSRFQLARLHGDGSVDHSFNPGVYLDLVRSIKLQPDGKVLINGTIRLNGNGSLDASFSPGPGVYGNVSSVALQPDGKVLIGGSFTTVNGTNRNRIARLNSNGTLDSSFNPGTGADNKVNTLVLQSDGKVLIGGEFTMVNGTNRNNFARLNATGGLDGGFDSGTEVTFNSMGDNVRSLVLQSDGKVIAGGYFDYDANHAIVRLNANGSRDTSFNPGTEAAYGEGVYSLASPPDGKVFAGHRFGIPQLNSDGSLASQIVYFLSSDDFIGETVFAVQTDGKVLVGGIYYSTLYDEVGAPVAYDAFPFVFRCNADGSRDYSFNLGTLTNFYQMKSITVQADGKVLMGGHIGTTGILRLNANGSLDGSFDPGSGAGGSYPFGVNSIAAQPNGKILIGGDFTTFDGTNRNGIARLNANGSLDTSFNPGTGARGRFAGSSGVSSVALQPDGKVLIGGHFITVNGSNRNRIARLNADGSLDQSFNPGTGANEGVLSIALQPDGNILIGGKFTSVNGVARPHVARLYGDFGAPRPSLNITRVSASVLAISWLSPSTGFTLQQNTNSIATVNWSNVLTTPTDNGTTKTVTVNLPTGNRFYRLKNP